MAFTSVNGRLAGQLSNSKSTSASPTKKSVTPKTRPPCKWQSLDPATNVQRLLKVAAENSLPTNSSEPPSNPAPKFITQQSCAVPIFITTHPTRPNEEDHGDLVASAAFHGAKLLSLWGGPPASTESSLVGICKNFKDQGGDPSKLGSIESMLYCQAVALQAIFSKIAQNAAIQPTFRQQDASLRLALKAQSQARATLEALAEFKNPRAVAFVKQANIAHNQQVNNGTGQSTADAASAHGKSEKAIEPNELLRGGDHG